MTAAKTMPLPPPCGTMTVTYGVGEKVKEPVFNESALRGFAEKAQGKDAETIRELLHALRCAEKWIDSAQHGDNCFVSDNYDGDPGSDCNCGKDGLAEFLQSVIEKTDGDQK